MDRNSIISSLMNSYSAYASSDSRGSIERVLKYGSSASDMVKRADIKTEVALFRLVGGTTIGRIEDDKPIELDQQWEVTIMVEQGDSHSIKESRYDRLLEISDQIVDWSVWLKPGSLNPDLLTVTLTSTGAIEERNGYLSANHSFNSIIKIQ